MNAFNDEHFQARSKVIVSVFPIACELFRPYGLRQEGGRTKFVLEAAPKGGYTKLKIYDMWQYTQDIDASSASGRQVMNSFLVNVGSLVHDLIQHWAVQRIGTALGFRPGIAVIEGEEPTDQELAALLAVQRGYFEGLYQEAKDLSARHEHKKIGDFHRAASVWLGHKEDWAANRGESIDWKDCLACYSRIDARATVCKVCRSAQEPVDATVPHLVGLATVAPLPPPETLAQRAQKLKPVLATA